MTQDIDSLDETKRQREDDVRYWADSEFDIQGVPIRLRENLFEASMRLKPNWATIMWLRKFYEECVDEMSSPEELAERRLHRMSDREIIESLYRKEFFTPAP